VVSITLSVLEEVESAEFLILPGYWNIGSLKHIKDVFFKPRAGGS
jgi:hypothetical protein